MDRAPWVREAGSCPTPRCLEPASHQCHQSVSSSGSSCPDSINPGGTPGAPPGRDRDPGAFQSSSLPRPGLGHAILWHCPHNPQVHRHQNPHLVIHSPRVETFLLAAQPRVHSVQSRPCVRACVCTPPPACRRKALYRVLWGAAGPPGPWSLNKKRVQTV